MTPGAKRADAKRNLPCPTIRRSSAEFVDDKGADRQTLCKRLIERGTRPVIPPRQKRKIHYDCNREIHRQCRVIERMVYRFKNWRRIATRFDRNIKNFMSAVI